MDYRTGFTYTGIAAISLGLGFIKGMYNTPYISGYVLGTFPFVSASIGTIKEHADMNRTEFASELDVGECIEEGGFDYVLSIGAGAASGFVLSGLCEAAGFGLGKLLSLK